MVGNYGTIKMNAGTGWVPIGTGNCWNDWNEVVTYSSDSTSAATSDYWNVWNNNDQTTSDWEAFRVRVHPAATLSTTSWCKYWIQPQKSARDRLRDILKSRHAPAVHSKSLDHPDDSREMAARQTLYRVLGEDGYRAFLKRGFVSVRAASGLMYQIFPGHGITAVYRDGKMVERLCVVLSGDFPPTDSLIMRYLLILNDEDNFRSHAIKHGVSNGRSDVVRQIDSRPLMDIYRDIKAGRTLQSA